jgi:hypothetical protein
MSGVDEKQRSDERLAITPLLLTIEEFFDILQGALEHH